MARDLATQLLTVPEICRKIGHKGIGFEPGDRALPYSDSGFDLRINYLESVCGSYAGVIVSLMRLREGGTFANNYLPSLWNVWHHIIGDATVPIEFLRPKGRAARPLRII